MKSDYRIKSGNFAPDLKEQKSILITYVQKVYTSNRILCYNCDRM